MATNLKLVAALFIVFVVATNSTCKKPCTKIEYAFNLNAKAYIDADSINIGDTVWLDINESTNLIDNLTNNSIDFSSASNLSTVLSIIEYLGNTQSRGAINDFTFILVKGQVIINSINPDLLKEYKFDEVSSKYLFKIGLIPNKKGVYRIGLSNAANVFQGNNNCSKASFTINFHQTNQHLYYNQLFFGVTVPLPNNLYCFKVK